MRRTTYSESDHTVTDGTPPTDGPSANSGLPNRLMTAFEVAEFVGCHEETVRRAYRERSRFVLMGAGQNGAISVA